MDSNEQRLKDGLAVAAGEALKLLSVGFPLSALAGLLVKLGLGLIFPNCDGPLIAEKIYFPYHLLHALAAPYRRSHTLSGSYDKKNDDHPIGCSTSHYEVHWNVSWVPKSNV